LIVKRRAQLAGLEGAFGAHSHRSGFVTEAGRQNIPLGDTMAMTGHRSIQPVMRCFQTGAIGQTRAAWLLGNDPSDGGTPDSVGLSCRLFKFTPPSETWEHQATRRRTRGHRDATARPPCHPTAVTASVVTAGREAPRVKTNEAAAEESRTCGQIRSQAIGHRIASRSEEAAIGAADTLMSNQIPSSLTRMEFRYGSDQ
jgi:hypothetical protein